MDLALRSPYPYPGGKSRVAAEVWRRLGNPSYFVEPFFGSGAVLLARPHRGRAETANDLDGFIANFWRAVSEDPEAVAAFCDWPIFEADLLARHQWLRDKAPELQERVKTDPHYFDAKIAGWWVWGLCQWIGSGWCAERRDGHGISIGRGGKGVHAQKLTMHPKGVHKKPRVLHPGSGVHRTRAAGSPTGVNRTSVRRDTLIAWFGELQGRLCKTKVLCGDFRRVLTPGTTTGRWESIGVFLDPPYDPKRRRRHLYNQDPSGVAEQARAWCLENGTDERFRICLCGLRGEHSDLENAGWKVLDWKRNSGLWGSASSESMWFSPGCADPEWYEQPGGLFDGGDA